jgi:hypothetical protein
MMMNKIKNKIFSQPMKWDNMQFFFLNVHLKYSLK